MSDNLLKNIDKYFKCSKCLLYDGKASDIKEHGWEDVCNYLKESKQEGVYFYSLDMFKDTLRQSILNLGNNQPASE